MQRIVLPLAATALAMAVAAPSHAGRPLQTEEAGVFERADCELEGASARLKLSGLSAREHSLQIGCGVGAATQLALAVACATARCPSACSSICPMAAKWPRAAPA